MINKCVDSFVAALTGVKDGDVILCSGFGKAGEPRALIDALAEIDVRDLTVVSNNGGSGVNGVAGLLKSGRVRKLICSYPRSGDPVVFDQLYREQQLELEIVPQGTMSERMRAAGAGIGGFFTRTGAGTRLAEGKETRMIDGQLHIFEKPLPGDFALIMAQCADRWGNLIYRKAARNFNPVMATAGKVTVAQIAELVDLGTLDPEAIATPGIYVDRLVVSP